MPFQDYITWAHNQVCTDCGAKAQERKDGELWATETQCFTCFRKYGPPEKRGLAGASEIAWEDATIATIRKHGKEVANNVELNNAIYRLISRK